MGWSGSCGDDEKINVKSAGQEGKFRPNTGGISLMAAVSVGIAMAGTALIVGKKEEKPLEAPRGPGLATKK